MTAPVLPVLLGDNVAAASSIRNEVDCVAGAADVEGSAQTIDASLSAAANGIYLVLTSTMSTSGSDTSSILRIKVDGVTRWAVQVGFQDAGNVHILPGYIPAGAEVTATLISNIASKSCSFVASFLSAAGGQKYGIAVPLTTADHATAERGVTVPSPGSSNTKTGWTELCSTVGSTDLCALIMQFGGNAQSGLVTANALVDIGIGGSGAESVLIPDLCFSSTVSEIIRVWSPLAYSRHIPAGSRLSARWQASSTAADLDVNLIGVQVP